MPAWTCPTCRREFARAKQSHSCERRTIDSHFAGKAPELRRLFDVLVRKLENTGTLRCDAVKTSIHLVSRHHFGGITVRRDSLRVAFLSRQPIDDRRIVFRQVLGPHRVEHQVVLASSKDVDAKVVRWLAAAQQMQS